MPKIILILKYSKLIYIYIYINIIFKKLKNYYFLLLQKNNL